MNTGRLLRITVASAAAMIWTLSPAPVLSQAKFPERPVRLVVPFAPGGQNDLIGRMWAQRVAPLLGQSIVVENRGGAGGTIGTVEAARAKPDGYTLLIGNTTTHVINPVAMSSPAYDALKDFAPVAIVTLVPTAVTVHPLLPVKTLKELVALAKANPGKLSYGSAGAGTITNLTGELFKRQGGGLDIVHIPYKGAGPGLQDLIAGHIPMYTPILAAAPISYHRAGRLRMLAVCAEKRVPAAPEVPTAIEAGMPGMVVQVFNAVLAGAGTPRAVIEQLHQATVKALADEAFQKDLRNAGAEPVIDTNPEQAARFIRDEIARWTPIIRASGFKID
jgi:tripartite-type tricarboxylate transporter receptor subunit TctC